MAQQAAGPSGPVDPQEVIFIEAVGDERARVAAASDRFDAAVAKSDLLQDDDSSAAAKRVREKTLAEEARLITARADLKAARGVLAAYGMAVRGALTPKSASAGAAKSDDEDAAERKELRMLKRKLPSPKDGWKDLKGVTHRSHADSHLLFQQLFDIPWKL